MTSESGRPSTISIERNASSPAFSPLAGTHPLATVLGVSRTRASHGPRREPGVRAKGDAIIRADRLADGFVLADAAGFTNRGTLAIGLSRTLEGFFAGVILGVIRSATGVTAKALNPYPEPR
jgi:hypothetical protein